jgi:hypothetical protein
MLKPCRPTPTINRWQSSPVPKITITNRAPLRQQRSQSFAHSASAQGWKWCQGKGRVLVAGLVAYIIREKKPGLNIRVKEQLRLPALVF